MIPAHSWLRADRFLEIARGALEDFGRRAGQGDKGHDLMKPLQQLAFAQREAVAPVTRLESALHPWVAYGIMPVFALANAGVYLGGIEGDGAGTGMVLLGVLLGLALGKPAGVLAMSWLAVRLKLGVLPAGIGWQHVAVVGIVAGIGFTMAIFIAELAFGGTDYLGIAKLGVLAGTGVAAVAALALGRLGLAVPPVAEPSEGDVEASTDYWTTAERSAAPPPR
jgi:NhaA family Na+:H+ antiporter